MRHTPNASNGLRNNKKGQSVPPAFAQRREHDMQSITVILQGLGIFSVGQIHQTYIVVGVGNVGVVFPGGPRLG